MHQAAGKPRLKGRVKPMMQRIVLYGIAVVGGVFVTFVTAPAVLSQRQPSMPGICDRAAVRAAQATQVPVEVLLAIARVETGRTVDGALSPWPWTINLSGEGAYFPTRDAAAAFVLQAVNSGSRSIDIGCFQINLKWHGAAFSSVTDMLDPDKNALYAARFLSRLHDARGNWPSAIGAFHSATPDTAERYRQKVAAVLDAQAVEFAQVGPVLPDNRFPLFQGGTGHRFGSLVDTDTAAILPLFR